MNGRIFPEKFTIVDAVMSTDRVEAAQKHDYETFLVKEPHIVAFCQRIAKVYGKKNTGYEGRFSEIRRLVRGLATGYDILYHNHCENVRLGINMDFDQAAMDHSWRGYLRGFRGAWDASNPATSAILCAKTLEENRRLVGRYDATPESLIGGEVIADGLVVVLPTGIYRLDSGVYIPAPIDALFTASVSYNPLKLDARAVPSFEANLRSLDQVLKPAA